MSKTTTRLDRAVVVTQNASLESSLRAANQLVGHLADAGPVIGYRPDKKPEVREFRDEFGPCGHEVLLVTPGRGFTEEQRTRVADYVEALACWHRLEPDIEWGEQQAAVRLHHPEQELAESEERSVRERFRDLFRGRCYKATMAMGRSLFQLGFRVREPVPATLITLNATIHGHVIMVKYPFPRTGDEAGINQVYDRILPLMVDAFAREAKMRSETLREGDVSMVFFTQNRKYVSTLYDSGRPCRPVIVRRPRAEMLGPAFMFGACYRACRALATQFKKDFSILKRPLPALHVKGYTVVLHYKRGAGGKVVDDSYLMVVGRMADKLADKHRIRCAIRHSTEARMIVVTFHDGLTQAWAGGRGYLS